MSHPHVQVPKEPIPTAKGAQAATEAALLQAGDLETQARQHQYARRRHLHKIGIVCLWVGTIAAILISAMSLWHLLTPWHLLKPAQLSTLNTVFVTSIISALLTFFVQEATR